MRNKNLQSFVSFVACYIALFSSPVNTDAFGGHDLKFRNGVVEFVFNT